MRRHGCAAGFLLWFGLLEIGVWMAGIVVAILLIWYSQSFGLLSFLARVKKCAHLNFRLFSLAPFQKISSAVRGRRTPKTKSKIDRQREDDGKTKKASAHGPHLTVIHTVFVDLFKF